MNHSTFSFHKSQSFMDSHLQQNTDLSFERQKKVVMEVVQQVSSYLLLALKDIDTLYRTRGIDFRVQFLYDTVRRLLTPFELLCYYRIVNCSDMVKLEAPSPKVSTVSKSIGNKDAKIKKQTWPSEKGKRSYNVSGNATHIIKTPNQEYPRGSRAKPILTPELEMSLVDWCVKNLNNGVRLRRKDIAVQALKTSGIVSGFEASIGWVNRFLGRHPNLRDMLMNPNLQYERNPDQSYYHFGVKAQEMGNEGEELASKEVDHFNYQNQYQEWDNNWEDKSWIVDEQKQERKLQNQSQNLFEQNGYKNDPIMESSMQDIQSEQRNSLFISQQRQGLQNSDSNRWLLNNRTNQSNKECNIFQNKKTKIQAPSLTNHRGTLQSNGFSNYITSIQTKQR